MTTSTTSTDTGSARASIWPTLITSARILLGPVVAGLVLWAGWVLYEDPLLAGFIYALTAIIFVIAALSDWIDGWLARKLNAVTPLGAALDHCADKVLVTCALVALAYTALPLHLMVAAVILLGRDVFVAGLREGLSNSGRTLPVGQIGKWKAAAEMAGIATFMAFQTATLLNGPPRVATGLSWAASGLIWIGAALALVSAFSYIRAAIRR